MVQANPTQQKHFNDYINATSIGVSKRIFLSTRHSFFRVYLQRIRDTLLLTAQYPLATTITDFWSMIYDQHVAIVAVLLRPDELQSIVRDLCTIQRTFSLSVVI